ncbi:unnamed protein product [Penicillium glandicola]
MFYKIFLFTLALGGNAHAAALNKRDNPFSVQAYHSGKPYGSEVQMQNAEKGMIATLNLDCGVVEVEANTAEVTQCNFYLVSLTGSKAEETEPIFNRDKYQGLVIAHGLTNKAIRFIENLFPGTKSMTT